MPVINENDTTATDEITFGDNDFLSAQVAILLEARLLVLLTDIEGLHTADPRTDAAAELVAEVDDFGELRRWRSATARRPSARAGCAARWRPRRWRARPGIPAVICNGTTRGTLGEAAAGERRWGPGSRPSPSARRASSCGCATRSPVQGRLVVDAGAARVLRESGSSLLPVGIVAVEGDFEAGDAVEVVCDGEVVGKGIATTRPQSSGGSRE